MKDDDFHKIIELAVVGGGLISANENAAELIEQSHKGEILSFMEITARDLRFHRAYFSLLNFIYGYLPNRFKKQVPEKEFYKWLKHLKKEYKVIFTFKDGTQLVEYDSISFGNMSQKRFENYVREQLPYIYENVIAEFFEGEIYDSILTTIELEYERFLAKL
jgi:hypothetical protein